MTSRPTMAIFLPCTTLCFHAFFRFSLLVRVKQQYLRYYRVVTTGKFMFFIVVTTATEEKQRQSACRSRPAQSHTRQEYSQRPLDSQHNTHSSRAYCMHPIHIQFCEKKSCFLPIRAVNENNSISPCCMHHDYGCAEAPIINLSYWRTCCHLQLLVMQSVAQRSRSNTA